jgi:hypothetical protein
MDGGLPQKYKKLYSRVRMKKMSKMIQPSPILSFQKKINVAEDWHGNCIKYNKSDTLISFLLKKVCFVPQGGPFSIYTFNRQIFVPGLRRC